MDRAKERCKRKQAIALSLSISFVFLMFAFSGVAYADAEDELFAELSKTPQPYVDVVLTGVSGDYYTYTVYLRNDGESCDYYLGAPPTSAGVYIEVPSGAYFYDGPSHNFDSYKSYSKSGEEKSLDQSEVMEFYIDSIESESTVSATFTIKATNVLQNQGSVDIKYRGWITDRNTHIVNPTKEVYDPWFDQMLNVYDNYVARYPYDYPDSRYEGVEFTNYRTLTYQSDFPQSVEDAANNNMEGGEYYRVLRKDVGGTNKYVIIYRDSSSHAFTGSLLLDQSGNTLSLADFTQEFAELAVLNLADYTDLAEKYTERYYLRYIGSENYANLIDYNWYEHHAVMASIGFGLIIFDTTMDFVSPLRYGSAQAQKHLVNNFLKVLLRDLVEDIVIEVSIEAFNEMQSDRITMTEPFIVQDIQSLHDASDYAESVFSGWSDIYTKHAYPDLKGIAIGMAFGYDSESVLLRMYTWNVQSVLNRVKEYYPYLINVSNQTEAIESIDDTIEILQDQNEEFMIFAYSVMTDGQELRNGYRMSSGCSNDNDGDGYISAGCGGTDCDDSNYNVNPGAAEVCNNIDDNCDGQIDPGCDCVNGNQRQCGTDVGICEFGIQTCINNEWGSCDGDVEPSTEACPDNELDDDCDGVVDETYCEGSGYCTNWNSQLDNYWIQSLHMGHYCATPWHVADVDSDTFAERYILTGETYRAWFACRAREATSSTVYDIGDGDYGDQWDSYGCTVNYDEDITIDKSYCDSTVEYSYRDIIYSSPQRKVESPKFFCYVQGAPNSIGWYSKELISCRDTNNNGQLCDDGDWIEPYLVLRCGIDDDCSPDRYCRKPDKDDPMTYYCELKCGDGICDPGETCPQDGSGPETCDNLDNDCDGDIDEGFGSTICGLGECRHTVLNCFEGFEQACDPFEGASSEVYDGLDNDCDGEIDEDWLNNAPPTIPIITNPYEGEQVNQSVVIDWLSSMDADGDLIRYYLEYSSDSGQNWYEIVSDYLLVNKFQDSATEKSLTFNDAGSQTIYISLPKDAVFTSASLDLNGYALSTNEGYDYDPFDQHYDDHIILYGNLHEYGGLYEPSYFFHTDLSIGYIKSWNFHVGRGGGYLDTNGKLEVCSTHATSLATSRSAIEAQCDTPFVIVNDSFRIPSVFWFTIEFPQPFHSYTNNIILKTYTTEINDPLMGGYWGMRSVNPPSTNVNYQYGYEIQNRIDKTLKHPFRADLDIDVYPQDLGMDIGDDGSNEWGHPGEFEVKYIPESITLDIDAINSFLSICTPDANGNCALPIKLLSSSRGIIRVSNPQFYSDVTEYEWITKDLPEGTYNIRIRAYDSYEFSEWHQSQDFMIIHSSIDNDMDGYNQDVDCDDNNPSIYPGAAELCNSADDDCDSHVDEDLAAVCGAGDCTGTQTCSSGVWGDCSTGGQSCDDGLFCNTGETCQSGTCGGGSPTDCSDSLFCTINEQCDESLDQCIYDTRDCGQYDLPEIATCLNDPDGTDYTWDYADGFTSICDDNVDACTTGSYIYTHACNKASCNAECESDTDCAATICNGFDGCYVDTYRDYTDADNTCLANCVCTDVACDIFVEIITDSDGDGYDTECDNDCDDSDSRIHPGAIEVCNNLDDDCDGSVDEDLNRQCGVSDTGICTYGTETCSAGSWVNCDAVLPGNEIECDGIDQDCDGSDLCSVVDNDGDGYNSDVDCDDTDPNISPGATEICNDGVDQDCTGADHIVTNYQGNTCSLGCLCTSGMGDFDGNIGCAPGLRYCNDVSEFYCTPYPGSAVCQWGSSYAYDMCDTECPVDLDNDEYCDSSYSGTGGAQCNDCDDRNGNVYPGATELCNNGIDDNCDGQVDEDCQSVIDDDQDGYDSDVDCDDNDPDINPGMTEICNDGIDQDCTGTDHMVTNYQSNTCSLGCLCTAGMGDFDSNVGCAPGLMYCNDVSEFYCTPYPGTSTTCSWGTSTFFDFCDTECPVDSDNDGHCSSAYSGDGGAECVDCNDANPNINPDVAEVCDNTVDDNCDGQVDEGCSDPCENVTCNDYCEGFDLYHSGFCQTGFCNYEVEYNSTTCGYVPDNDSDGYTSDVDCNDNNPDVNPGATETCDNIDNDCDGQVDEITRQFGSDIGECQEGTETCQTGTWVITTPEIGPRIEACDNLDNNCDGLIDNDLTRQCGVSDIGACTYGTETCSAGSWVNCDAVLPGTEIECNGIDEDCDGQVDEGCSSPVHWWDSGWGYKKQVIVEYAGDQDITDYPLMISSFDCSSHCNTDGSDIRVIDESTDTVLDFGVKKISDSVFDIALRTELVPGQVIEDVYVYYGNTAATATGSWESARYEIYDEFDGTSVDSSIWSSGIQADGGQIITENSELKIITGSGRSRGGWIESLQTFNLSDYNVRMETTVKSTFNSIYGNAFRYGLRGYGGYDGLMMHKLGGGCWNNLDNYNQFKLLIVNNLVDCLGGGIITATFTDYQTHIFDFKKDYARLELIEDGDIIEAYGNHGFENLTAYFYASNSDQSVHKEMWIDHIKVYKYLDSEPTYTVGEELWMNGSVAQDNDGDGYYSDVDCDDNDPDINPGMTEICNDGIDQDCTGTDHMVTNYQSNTCSLGCLCTAGMGDLDSNSECAPGTVACHDLSEFYCTPYPGTATCQWGTSIWYDLCDTNCPVDSDNDGHCNSAYSGTGGAVCDDCNDGDVNINPGVAEICDNAIDDNCDGQVDEGCQSTEGSFFTDFETDTGWVAAGTGEGRFEIGVPSSFDDSDPSCQTTCSGTGIGHDTTPSGSNAACTNLDGYQQRFEDLTTNSLTSPVYDMSGKNNVAIQMWVLMEIEGQDYDFCYFQYKDSPGGTWTTFQTFGLVIGIDWNPWMNYYRDLSPFANNKEHFQIRFYCTTDDWTEGSGLCVDDIEITYS